MKANELMIRDFFLYRGNVVEIVSIDGGTETVWIDGKKVSALRKVDDLQPIPLTPEILERNGFVYNDENAKYYPNCWDKNGILLRKRTLNGFFYLVTSDYDDQDTNSTSIIITYVHELQHLLKLCRIEKTIEL